MSIESFRHSQPVRDPARKQSPYHESWLPGIRKPPTAWQCGMIVAWPGTPKPTGRYSRTRKWRGTGSGKPTVSCSRRYAPRNAPDSRNARGLLFSSAPVFHARNFPKIFRAASAMPGGPLALEIWLSGASIRNSFTPASEYAPDHTPSMPRCAHPCHRHTIPFGLGLAERVTPSFHVARLPPPCRITRSSPTIASPGQGE